MSLLLQKDSIHLSFFAFVVPVFPKFTQTQEYKLQCRQLHCIRGYSPQYSDPPCCLVEKYTLCN